MKITYFDKQGVWAALREFIKEMTQSHPEIEKVILFGSLARDEAVPGSDVDLLVILKGSSLPFLDRIPLYLPRRFPVGVEVFPYTKEEIEKMNQEGHFFLKRALGEGIELFRRADI